MPIVARPRLGRDIALALAAKAIALALLWAFFFSPAQRVPADPARHLAGSP
jgi:hypothetical protein